METPSLGDRTYVVHDGEVAFVVDPQRDIDRVLEILEADGVRLTHVFETHIHNDYVTGGLALAQATGADYLVNAADEVSFDRTPISDGESVKVGPRMRVRALSTPGHTFTHLSYALASADDSGAEQPYAVFTGGSLLYGATGRPDLLGEEHTDALVRHQHASASKLAEELPDDAEVYPTHGFGSFCSATQSDATASTIGEEKRSNPVLTQDEETYVRELLDGLGAWPAYYVHMGPANAAGPRRRQTSPRCKRPTLPSCVDASRPESGWSTCATGPCSRPATHRAPSTSGSTARSRPTSAGSSSGAPRSLCSARPPATSPAPSVSWCASESTAPPPRPAAARGWTTGELSSFPTATFADLAQVRRHREVVVLDVRRADEHQGAAIAGAINIPIHELPRRVAEVPAGEVWVHCASGYRASIAASFIDAAGRTPVAVDDSFENAERVGLHLVSPDPDRSQDEQQSAGSKRLR